MAKKFLVVLAIIFLQFSTCAAEYLKFIDSGGDDGYFIDTDTINIQSPQVFNVNMIIIRLNINQMEVIDLQINHSAKTYIIRSTRTLSYDERTEISADYAPRPARGYSDKSLMGDIVQIVLYGGD